MKHILLATTLVAALSACQTSKNTSDAAKSDKKTVTVSNSSATAANSNININPNVIGSWRDLVTNNQTFGIEVFQKLYEEGKNQFISPFSISSALAMTYRGANGDTEAEMARVLHYGANDAGFHAAFGKLTDTIEQAAKANKIDIRIANKLWGSLKYQFKQDFLDDAKKYYGGGFERIDMKNNAAAVKTINQWVEGKTENKIKDLLKPEHIDELTHLVLVNAIYFLGGWDTDFEKDMTHKRDFTTWEGMRVETDFMFMNTKTAAATSVFKYNEDEFGQWLEMPYSKGAASMVILLPKKMQKLSEVLPKLSGKDLEQGFKGLQRPSVPIRIYLPKWKTTYDLSLVETMEKLGMTVAFSDNANFSKMSEPSQMPLKIGNIIHKAFIEVSEKGTEAAAATAVIMVEITSAGVSRDPIKEIEFMADRPYMYFIRDNATGSLLFMGTVNNPKE